MLTKNQIEQYHEEGYLVVQDFFPPEFVQEIADVTSELVRGAENLEKTDDWFDLEPSHQPGVAPRVRRLKDPNGHHPIFNKVARHPKLIAAIEALNGRPGVRFTHPKGKVNIKAAHYGSAVEWHQDWAGYPHTNDDLLSFSVPLDDSREENGPLMVLPGTHKGPVYDHRVDGIYRSAMDPDRDGIDFTKAIPLLGNLGMVYFHHARIIHGSALNRSNRDRRLLINQYAAADAWPLMGIKDLKSYNDMLISGEPTLTPLMRECPVRLPLPKASDFDGVYSNQEKVKNRYFEVYKPTEKEVAESTAAG